MNTKDLTRIAIGIALYACLSMSMKIPLIGHISLDLGYIVLTVYAYKYGALHGAIVGGAGCVLVSLLAYGWFPIGWLPANLLIGALCGAKYKHDKGLSLYNIAITLLAVFIGIVVVKTAIECCIFSIPVLVKLVKDLVAFATDSAVMMIGLLIVKTLEVQPHE